MPQGDASSTDQISDDVPPASYSKPDRQKSSPWLRTPVPVKRVFDKFPLVTYDANDLPQGRAISRKKHALYIFTTPEDAEKGRPSYNPGCLKWQAYLLFQGLGFTTVPSSNHASPSGALPFLLPISSTPTQATPVPSTSLQRWASATKSSNEKGKDSKQDNTRLDGNETTNEESHEDRVKESPQSNIRYKPYLSLLDHRIRNAYLYTLYLSQPNFASIVRPKYIDSTTSNYLVRLTLAYQLRNAAQSELLKYSTTIDVESLYRESDTAFGALANLLGDHENFFDEGKPGLFDAAVFAYTNTLLHKDLQWKERRMTNDLSKYGNLVSHQHRILAEYFPSTI